MKTNAQDSAASIYFGTTMNFNSLNFLNTIVLNVFTDNVYPRPLMILIALGIVSTKGKWGRNTYFPVKHNTLVIAVNIPKRHNL